MRELLSGIFKLKPENKQLRLKFADLSVTNDIMTEAIEISKKIELLKQVRSVLDTCDREMIGFIRKQEPTLAVDIQRLMMASVDKRFESNGVKSKVESSELGAENQLRFMKRSLFCSWLSKRCFRCRSKT